MKAEELVVAGSYNQFRTLARDTWKDYVYLSLLPEQIRGRQNTTLILTGTWYQRKDWNDWEEDIRAYCLSHNIKIIQKETLFYKEG